MNKKQKRAVLEAKRARELEETRQEGLRALERDRARRERQKQAAAKKKQDELEAVVAAKRAIQDAIYEEYLAEEEACRQRRAVTAMRAMASRG